MEAVLATAACPTFPINANILPAPKEAAPPTAKEAVSSAPFIEACARSSGLRPAGDCTEFGSTLALAP